MVHKIIRDGDKEFVYRLILYLQGAPLSDWLSLGRRWFCGAREVRQTDTDRVRPQR